MAVNWLKFTFIYAYFWLFFVVSVLTADVKGILSSFLLLPKRASFVAFDSFFVKERINLNTQNKL